MLSQLGCSSYICYSTQQTYCEGIVQKSTPISLVVLVYDHKFRMRVTRSVFNSYKRLIDFRSGLARNCCTHWGRLREWRKRGEEVRIEEGLEWRVSHSDFRCSNNRVKMPLVFGHLSFKRNNTQTSVTNIRNNKRIV